MTFRNTKNIRERDNNIYIDDINIDTVNKIKMLGLNINKTLNWSANIKYISNKICSSITRVYYLPYLTTYLCCQP